MQSLPLNLAFLIFLLTSLSPASAETEPVPMTPSIEPSPIYSDIPSSAEVPCADKGGEGQERCTKVPATIVTDAKFGCRGKQLYLSDGNCYRCPAGFKRASLTRKMDHPQACQERGLPKVNYTAATFVRDSNIISGCKGKQLYLSDGGCYSCPAGFKRASLTRKMTHHQACQERGLPKSDYTYATLERDAFGCPDGSFKHDGDCKVCPAHTKRMHFAGLDSGNCKVPRELHCQEDLVLAKRPPENLIERIGNWGGMSIMKLCAPKIDYNQLAYESIENVGTPLIEAIVQFSIKMIMNDEETQRKTEQFKQQVKDKDIQAALETLQSFDEYPLLVEAANAAGQISISVGFTVDGSFGVGGNYEKGLAIDLVARKVRWYSATGLTKGLSFGGDIGINVGAWSGGFVTGYSQGFLLDIQGSGVGAWFNYYTPEDGQPRVIGLTGSGGLGHGFEIGEYNEVYTKVGSEVISF